MPANQWSIIHNWRTVADEGADDSSRRSPKNPDQHLKTCRPHSPSLRFMIQKWQRNRAKMASRADFQDQKQCGDKRECRVIWHLLKRQKKNLRSGPGHCVWCKTQYFIKNNGSRQTVVAAWWAVAAVPLYNLGDLLNLIKQGILLSARETDLKHAQAVEHSHSGLKIQLRCWINHTPGTVLCPELKLTLFI